MGRSSMSSSMSRQPVSQYPELSDESDEEDYFHANMSSGMMRPGESSPPPKADTKSPASSTDDTTADTVLGRFNNNALGAAQNGGVHSPAAAETNPEPEPEPE